MQSLPGTIGLWIVLATVFVGYGVWLALTTWQYGPLQGTLRAAAAFVAAGLMAMLSWYRHPGFSLHHLLHRPIALGTPGITVCAIAASALSPWFPPLWAVALALAAAAACAAGSDRALLRQQWIPAVLLLGAFPYEGWFGEALDLKIQTATAHLAMPLIRLTGLPIRVEVWQHPVLLGPDLIVHVTALCAGAQTLLALSTLGMVLAAVFVPPGGARVAFVVLTPIVGFAGNVLRVAVSTHAANAWANDALLWTIAHDAIGYAVFLLVYGSLFLLIKKLRAQAAAPRR